MIYVIACTKTKTCKIGYSNNPQKRLKELQVANPNKLKLAKVIQGTINEEQTLHKTFEHLRLSGEWFQFGSELKNYFQITNEDLYDLDSNDFLYTSNNSWKFVTKLLTPLEYQCASILSMYVCDKMNKIQGVSQKTNLQSWMKVWNISINKVKPILNKLKEYEIIINSSDSDDLLFNPYLTRKEKQIDSKCLNLFKNTLCAKAYRGEI